MDRWKKELLDFILHLLFMMAIGGLIIYLFVGVIVGGDMKHLLIPSSLLLSLAILKLWRHRMREKKEIENYLKNTYQGQNLPQKKLYRIKKAVDEMEVERLLEENDICILESRNLINGEFEGLVFFKDSQDFLVVNNYLKWKIKDPLKMILNSGDMSYSKITKCLTDILGNTLVAKEGL